MDYSDVTDRVRSAGRGAIRAAAMATAGQRPLPDLVIVGVKRGGTTSLFRDLERHSSMSPLVPSARRLPLMRENMKGVHYFDTNFARSPRWYRSHFATRQARNRIARRSGASFAAEASPYYFFHPLGARRAASALHEATFVVMLRDPVERTVSHWAEQTRNGVETLPLADALAAEAHRVGNDATLLANGQLQHSRAHEQQTYAAQSEYADSLRRWFDRAGPDRVMVMFSEHYYANPGHTLRTISDRLGISPSDDRPAIRRNAATRPAEIDPAVEQMLIERFGPDVDRVSELIGRRPPWPRFE